MARWHLSATNRACIAITITMAFLIAEIAVGFHTGALVLVADAFHCLNDVITFFVALSAVRLTERDHAPPILTFGWQRAAVLGAFFNAVFLLALGLSILLQAIQRLIKSEKVEQPRLILIMGIVGLVMNLSLAAVYHQHDHDHSDDHNHEHQHKHEHEHEHLHKHNDAQHKKAVSESDQDSSSSSSKTVPTLTDITTTLHDLESAILSTTSSSATALITAGPLNTIPRPSLSVRLLTRLRALLPHDLNTRAVLLHLLSDALNDIGVILASLILLYSSSPHRFYADPVISILIAVSIASSALPLVRKSGGVLLCVRPGDVDFEAVMDKVRGIEGVGEVRRLVVWRLSQEGLVVGCCVLVNRVSGGGEDGKGSCGTRNGAKGGGDGWRGEKEEDVGSLDGVSRNRVLKAVEQVLREQFRPHKVLDLTIQVEEYEGVEHGIMASHGLNGKENECI